MMTEKRPSDLEILLQEITSKADEFILRGWTIAPVLFAVRNGQPGLVSIAAGSNSALDLEIFNYAIRLVVCLRPSYLIIISEGRMTSVKLPDSPTQQTMLEAHEKHCSTPEGKKTPALVVLGMAPDSAPVIHVYRIIEGEAGSRTLSEREDTKGLMPETLSIPFDIHWPKVGDPWPGDVNLMIPPTHTS
jgi:hypothetical protein